MDLPFSHTAFLDVFGAYNTALWPAVVLFWVVTAGVGLQQIKALHEQSRQAALKGDASFLEKYLTDDHVGIGGDGRMITKDQEIQMLESGAIKYDAIDEHDVKVRVYGDTASSPWCKSGFLKKKVA